MDSAIWPSEFLCESSVASQKNWSKLTANYQSENMQGQRRRHCQRKDWHKYLMETEMQAILNKRANMDPLHLRETYIYYYNHNSFG